MNIGIPIYKFATLRNPTNVVVPSDIVKIQPDTTLVSDLITINESADSDAQKLSDFNDRLQLFIEAGDFIKTKLEFDTLKPVQDATPTQDVIDLLYDNILVRTLTKCSTNLLYKLIVEQLKSIYIAVNSLAADTEFSIIIPERLIFTFANFPDTGDELTAPDSTEQLAILAELQELHEVEKLLIKARNENVISFESGAEVIVKNTEFSKITSALKTSSISVSDAQSVVDTKIATLTTAEEATKTFYKDYDSAEATATTVSAVRSDSPIGVVAVKQQYEELKRKLTKAATDGVETIEDTKTVSTTKYASILTTFEESSLTIEAAEELLKESMETASREFHKLANNKKFSLIGDRWVETSRFASRDVTNTSGGIMSHPNDCTLKTPFQIADLKVIEQLSVGYLPGEIAHINNTQAGETNTRVTRRLKKVDSYESLITDEETFKETDTQSTERSGMESEAFKAQTEASSFNIGASVSGSYGPISATIDTGYSNSSSTTNANSNSQYQAKEIVQNIVERVSNRVQTERSVRTIEEFEETVTHVITNIGEGTKSYVYRWLNKLVKATLKNYGKRLIFQFDIAHPAHYYLKRAINDIPILNLPPDPRELSIDGNKVLKFETISRDNYLAWGTIYKVELPQPPQHSIIISDSINGKNGWLVEGKVIPIDKGYKCSTAEVTIAFPNVNSNSNIMFLLGNDGYYSIDGGELLWSPLTVYLNGETDKIPLTVIQHRDGFMLHVEIKCELTENAYNEWKINVFNEIVNAYDRLKAEAESEQSSFNPNLPGLHPMKKEKVMKDELKKESIRKMFRCNPFWVNDNYIVGQEYTPNCCLDSTNAEKARFIENTFDWNNLTYELFPYFYADKDCWSQILDLSDSDPRFEAFLQASYATVRVPVFRDTLKEIAAMNFIMNNSIANYEVLPETMETILDELKNNQPSLFTYDLDGTEIAEPTDVIDLGIFQLPTSLVILECGNANGIVPIGFPQEDEETTDISIPKQYSPAIIADTCTP
ncbi:MAG: hypothetical protein K9J13_17270 [Saprospiraceae bacterium]|nr:hypothetical protein [Saprospiraceae bacterium]